MQKCRQRANLEGATNFITDAELIGEINTSLAEWWDLVRSTTWNGQQFRNRYNFVTTPTAIPNPYVSPPPGSFYPLPSDFAHVISVDIAISSSCVITATQFQEEQRNVFKFYPVGAWIWNQPVYYQIQGPNIVFIPGPIGNFNIQVNYCPIAPTLARPLDSFDSINSWEEFIVLDVAIKLLIKDGQTDIIPLLQGRLEQQRARIKTLVPKRDMQQSEMVHEAGGSDDFADWW
jgi:hypothetical protein